MYPLWSITWILLSCRWSLAQQDYIGCFKSSQSDPELLTNLVAKRITSQADCVKECKARYNMYAGLMNGHQCYCGSHYGKHGPSNDCNQPCYDDKTLFCGSQEAISVYATGQLAPSPPRGIAVTKREQEVLEVIWQPPDVPNGEILGYTIKASALQSFAPYPLPPTETEVVGRDSNTTTLYGLHPGTKYNISIVARNTKEISEPAYTYEYTKIGPPEKPTAPTILDIVDNTIIIEIKEGKSENGPLTFYNIVVVQPGVVPPTDHNVSYDDYSKASLKELPYYVTGKFEPKTFKVYSVFTVGDGSTVGSYYNAPLLKDNGPPQIGVALESRVRGEWQYSYSDLTPSVVKVQTINTYEDYNTEINVTNIVLWVLIVVLTTLLLGAVVVFLLLRKKHQEVQMRKLPEQQELTLQGPMYEVDNMAYIPEDVPERTNHYQELKNKVWTIPRNFLNYNPTYVRRGRFGTVHTGTVLKDGVPVPVFVHKISDTQLKNSEKRQMLRELDICIKAGTHRFLASFVGNCETPETLFVAMEMPAQSLKTRLLGARSGEIFPHTEILKIGACVAQALRHLASINIVHTHLCARSIGLTETNWMPKLMGHGLSKFELEDIKYARWTAVECFAGDKRKNHMPGVVWAFGVLLWEMFSLGGTPYADLEMDSDVEDALNHGRRLGQLMDVPDPVYEVMSSCWLACPEERPTFDELVRLDTLAVCPITSITELYRPELELN